MIALQWAASHFNLCVLHNVPLYSSCFVTCWALQPSHIPSAFYQARGHQETVVCITQCPCITFSSQYHLSLPLLQQQEASNCKLVEHGIPVWEPSLAWVTPFSTFNVRCGLPDSYISTCIWIVSCPNYLTPHVSASRMTRPSPLLTFLLFSGQNWHLFRLFSNWSSSNPNTVPM